MNFAAAHRSAFKEITRRASLKIFFVHADNVFGGGSREGRVEWIDIILRRLRFSFVLLIFIPLDPRAKKPREKKSVGSRAIQFQLFPFVSRNNYFTRIASGRAFLYWNDFTADKVLWKKYFSFDWLMRLYQRLSRYKAEGFFFFYIDEEYIFQWYRYRISQTNKLRYIESLDCTNDVSLKYGFILIKYILSFISR